MRQRTSCGKQQNKHHEGRDVAQLLHIRPRAAAGHEHNHVEHDGHGISELGAELRRANVRYNARDTRKWRDNTLSIISAIYA